MSVFVFRSQLSLTPDVVNMGNILQNQNKLSEIKKMIIGVPKLEECGCDQEICHVTRK